MKAYQMLLALAAGITAIAISQQKNNEDKVGDGAAEAAEPVPGVEIEPESYGEMEAWFI